MRRLLLALLFAVSCRPTADRPSALPPAHRIVSLAPSSTELLFALGAGDQVVGRTTWCRYPPAALDVPDVGDGLNPNIEAIAARRPDLVVLYRSPMNETAAAQLRRLGIASVTLPQDRLEDIASAARELGRRTRREAAGDSIAGAIEALLGKAPPAAIAQLAFVVWDNPPMVIGAGSYLDQLATLAGGSNVFHDLGAASATVSIETIAARNPDVILVLSDSTALPSYSRRPEWRAIRAVREGRFIMLPADLFGRPSPTAPAAVAVLRRALERTARR
jgi:ABC-type Fe3+-hydroxamate transport system substrate-binding protein